MRRLDHVNLLASDVTVNKDFMMERLGFRLQEHIVMKDGTEAGAWISVSPLVHEIAFMRDGKGAGAACITFATGMATPTI